MYFNHAKLFHTNPRCYELEIYSSIFLIETDVYRIDFSCTGCGMLKEILAIWQHQFNTPDDGFRGSAHSCRTRARSQDNSNINRTLLLV